MLKHFILPVILISSGMSVIKAQELYPIVPKQHFSCKYFGIDSRRPMLEKDIDAASQGSANQLARATELEFVNLPNRFNRPTRWVLLSDLNSSTKSDTYEEGVGVSCSPSSVISQTVIYKQVSGQPYILAEKHRFVCTYKSEDRSRMIYDKEIFAVNELHAIRVARVGELKWDDQSIGRPGRWVLMSDLNNGRPTFSFTAGVRVSCLAQN